MRKLLAATALAVLVAAPAAHAADRTGFLVGARAAYAWPLGSWVGQTGAGTTFDRNLNKLVDHSWPLWLELNYRFGPSFELGAYGQYAFVNFANTFGGNTGSDLRAGLQLNYIVAPGGGLTPWIGIGAGYEWLKGDTKFDVTNLGATTSTTIKGWDFMVQGGADFHAGDRFTLGPFAALSAGQFSDISGAPSVNTLENKAWHEWLQVGLRATFF